jgi:hypothetical protein
MYGRLAIFPGGMGCGVRRDTPDLQTDPYSGSDEVDDLPAALTLRTD